MGGFIAAHSRTGATGGGRIVCSHGSIESSPLPQHCSRLVLAEFSEVLCEVCSTLCLLNGSFSHHLSVHNSYFRLVVDSPDVLEQNDILAIFIANPRFGGSAILLCLSSSDTPVSWLYRYRESALLFLPRAEGFQELAKLVDELQVWLKQERKQAQVIFACDSDVLGPLGIYLSTLYCSFVTAWVDNGVITPADVGPSLHGCHNFYACLACWATTSWGSRRF